MSFSSVEEVIHFIQQGRVMSLVSGKYLAEIVVSTQPPAHRRRSISVAALAVSAWDVCITFDHEVERIWSLPWRSPTKTLFLISRYGSILALSWVTKLPVIL
jgi:hypothetical protein